MMKPGKVIKLQRPLKNLQYWILPSANPAQGHVEKHNQIFDFWMGSLIAAYAETNNDPKQLLDEFIYQDFITAICHGDQVIATLLLSFYSIDAKAARAFRYLKDNYPDIYFEKLKRKGATTLMSMQYLTIHPDWRKSQQSVHIATVIVVLGRMFGEGSGIDATIAVARADRKVNEMVYALGGECVIASVENHNTPCDLIAMYKNKPYKIPTEEMNKLVHSLWESRVDCTKHKGNKRKKAA